MHILFLSDNFPPEGNAIASRVYERACYWVKWGHQVTVITSVPNFPEGKVYAGYRNKLYQVEMMNGIRVVRIATFIAANKGFVLRTIDFLSYIFPALLAGILQKKPDIVIATSPQFFVGITAWLVAFCKRRPFILEVADIWPASIVGVGAMQKSTLINLLEKLELFLYKRACAIVTLTSAFKDNLVERKVPPKKINVVINGVDLTRYKPQKRDHALRELYGIPKNNLVVGYIGTHGMAHALENVLNTAAQCDDQTISFLFVGAGAKRDELMAAAKKRNLKNIQFVPAQPKDKILNFWSICDIALVHLKNDAVFAEVIPSKIFEAMGMGLPILLAAPEGEASAIINRERVGIWVPAENPQALKNAIYKLKDLQLRRKYALTSANRAKKFSREQQAQAMLKVMLNTLFESAH